jgi:hypothetical protein
MYWAGSAGGAASLNNLAQIHQHQDQLVARGEKSRALLWKRIEDETSSIRHEMALKFKAEF